MPLPGARATVSGTAREPLGGVNIYMKSDSGEMPRRGQGLALRTMCATAARTPLTATPARPGAPRGRGRARDDHERDESGVTLTGPDRDFALIAVCIHMRQFIIYGYGDMRHGAPG